MNRPEDGARPPASMPAGDSAAAVAVVSCGDRRRRPVPGAGTARGEARVRAAGTPLDLLHSAHAAPPPPVTTSPVQAKTAGYQPAGTAPGAGPHGTLSHHPCWPSWRGGAAP